MRTGFFEGVTVSAAALLLLLLGGASVATAQVPRNLPGGKLLRQLLKQGGKSLPGKANRQARALLRKCYRGFKLRRSSSTPGGDLFDLGTKVLHKGRRALSKTLLRPITYRQEYRVGLRFHRYFSRRFKFFTSPGLLSRVRAIGKRVSIQAPQRPYPYRFYVVRSRRVNAITLPGGFVYVFTGLLRRMKTTDEVAFVLAHELSHNLFRHAAEKLQVVAGAKRLLGRSWKLGAIGTKFLQMAYDQHKEHEADAAGICLMYLAGYRPKYSVSALYRIAKANRKLRSRKGKHLLGKALHDYLSTHPLPRDRMLRARQMARFLSKKKRPRRRMPVPRRKAPVDPGPPVPPVPPSEDSVPSMIK